MKKLKSIEEHNMNRQASYTPQLSGIACPKCLSELSYTSSLQLLSNPPQLAVHCSECGYSTYVLS